MAHSNSSLNCFAACMKKYEHSYILHTPPCKPLSPHLTFGTMAHDVLHKAGIQRDEIRDGVREKTEYSTVIPSELMHTDLKDTFKIYNWHDYFIPIIKKTAEYEEEMIKSFTKGSEIHIEREVKLQLTCSDLANLGLNFIQQPIVGVLDLLIYTKDEAVVLDYKFSNSNKTQDDFDMNSQLPLYALLISYNYGIPVENIRVGYIDIPKKSFDKPILLSDGKLSRSKTQNVMQESYAKYVAAVHDNDPYYNCEPGGYYYECWCAMANNKPAYLQVQYLDMEAYDGITKDLFDAAEAIDRMKERNMKFLKKYDSYSCKGCEYLKACKPWLEVNWE